MTERIRVSGFRQPIVYPQRSVRVRPVASVRPLNLIGLVGAFGMLAAVLAWGTPHLLLATRASVFGSTRFYDDCAYASLDGRVVHLRGSACPLFRLLHEGR